MNLDEAIAAGDFSITELSLDLATEAFDERIGQFTALESLSLYACASTTVGPEALQRLPKLRKLLLRAPDKRELTLPPFVGQLALTSLDVDHPLLETARVPSSLTHFRVWTKQPERDLRLVAHLMPNLRSLEVIGEDCVGTVLPVELARLSGLASLRLSRLAHGPFPTEWSQLTRLRELELLTREVERDVSAAATLWPGLTTLDVSGEGETAFAIPSALARLSALEVFALRRGRVTAFAPEFSQLGKLKTLTLNTVPGGLLPECVCDLPALETLRLAQAQLVGLPGSLSKLTTLRELDLSGSLNKGAMVSSYDDRSLLKALPRVLSELVWLEKLNLDCCAAFDAAPLRPLQRLRELSMTWSGLETFEDVGALRNLEVLNLEYADSVADLSPLAQLTKLRELDLSHTRTRDLAALRSLPQLKKLNLVSVRCKDVSAVFELDLELKADDEVLEKYEQRSALRKLPPIATLVADLSSPDLQVAEVALGHVATWTIASSTRDANAIGVALEKGDRALPVLDACLDRHLSALSPAVLARTFEALFHDPQDDFEAALRVAREIVKRGGSEAQCALVAAFERANEHYDTGHRMMEFTVHDALIDEVFPALESVALTRLVTWCSDGHFDADGNGDSMVDLFLPALERANDDQREAVIARLEKYLLAKVRYSTTALEAVQRQLAALTQPASRQAFDALQQRLERVVSVRRERQALEKDLESLDPARVAHALATTAGWEKKSLSELQGAMWKANDCLGLEPSSLRLLVMAWQRLGHSLGLDEAIGLSARAGLPALRAIAREVGIDDAALGRHLRGAVISALKEVGQGVGYARRMNEDPAPVRQAAEVTLAALRSAANEVEQVDAAEGRRREVTDLLITGVGHYELDRVRMAVEALDACPDYVAAEGFASSKTPAALASDVGQLVGNEDEWPMFCVLARNLHKLKLTGKSLERLLAQLLAVAIRVGDDSAKQAVLALVPPSVTWDILAFNLACHFAAQRDRAGVFEWTRRSLALGKGAEQFLADPDFAPWAGDPEFIAILDASR